MLGYRLKGGKLIVVPEEAEIVRWIYSEYLSGKSVHKITKELKNTGERDSYLVTKSHEPIIAPDVYERVQRELARRRSARPKKPGEDSPFANRLVCGDCGAFYGHKVWRSGGRSRKRYDVWYCNHRYDGEDRCKTPTLRDDEIKASFVKLLKEAERPETEFSTSLWREMVEEVTIQAGRQACYLLVDAREFTVPI